MNTLRFFPFAQVAKIERLFETFFVGLIGLQSAGEWKKFLLCFTEMVDIFSFPLLMVQVDDTHNLGYNDLHHNAYRREPYHGCNLQCWEQNVVTKERESGKREREGKCVCGWQ